MNVGKCMSYLRTTCRLCKSTDMIKFLSLGKTPLANSYLKPEELKIPEPSYPLETYFCQDCGLVQLLDIIPGEVLFRNYLYISSTAPSYIEHFTKYAQDIVKRFDLTDESFVIEFGSNDGILLKPLKNLGIKTLGVDPAENIAKIAESDGIETFVDFFTEDNAKIILEKYGPADIITSANVFAHIDDLDDVLRGVSVLLKDDGIFVAEATYMVNMLEKKYFDLIYHEHVSYYCIRPLQRFFEKFDMEIFDVEDISTAGGSIRVYAKRKIGKHNITESVSNHLALENRLKMDQAVTYKNYGNEIEKCKNEIMKLLLQLKDDGKTIVGYGAAAKGNTLLNYFGIGTDILDYVVDIAEIKHGLFTPGKHIPILPTEKIDEDNPDYVLILAWNFADDIMKKHEQYRTNGGKFIIPLPEIDIK
ncbi:MAG: SAM-dependent methyltransferase [Thaumarchaeota archaeon]|nr:SAM-dependent methyltransferase [Nitrososphaerota archaeon]